MKNFISIVLLFATISLMIACNCPECPPQNAIPSSSASDGCNDSCTVPNDYCNGDNALANGGYEVATADIKIDTFMVSRDGDDHLLLKVTVSNNNDDDARESRLVVLLPTDVCEVSVVHTDPLTTSYHQCGGRIEFCLGQLATAGTAGQRSMTIRTHVAKLPQMTGRETFAGFVYSSTPDLCPLNNFRSWVNDSVSCYNGFDPASLVNKGF